MNFKRYHVSRNLFDKDNTTVHNAYFAANGDWIASADSRSVLIAVTPNTQYTLSISDEIPIFRIYQTSVSNPTYNNQFQEIIRETNMKTYTFTTASAAKYIGFQGSSASIDIWLNSLMFNTGSQPLPYEPYGDTWTDIPHYIHNTSTDTITTLPADVYADGNNATVGLVGNMSQTGTPTPTTPIQPSETGERTGNLFDKDNLTYGFIETDGRISPHETFVVSSYLPLDNGISFSATFGGSVLVIYAVYDNNHTFVTGSRVVKAVASFNIPAEVGKYVLINFSSVNSNIDTVMINEGSTALPFEPFGIKIPILSGGVTTPVYLGEVQTTRRIKKLVLTGEEDWYKVSSVTAFYTNITDTLIATNSADYIKSSHYQSSMSGDNGTIRVPNNANRILIFDNYSIADDLKTYLQQQYSAGTPVCIWYVLAEPTTGIVNEPLRKIGDYADTVSGITIPTIAGKDSFDVLTTLKPSEVSLAYTGWHDASAKEWDGSEWQ